MGSRAEQCVERILLMLILLAYYFYTQGSDWKKYILTLLLFELGLLSKPSIMTLPFVLLFLDLWPLKRIHVEGGVDTSKFWGLKFSGIPVLRLVLEKIPFIFLSLGSFLYNVMGANKRMGLYSTELKPLGLRVSNVFVSYVKYLWKSFWPHDLVIFYPYPASIPWWQTASTCLVIVLLTISALRAVYKYPYYIVGWLWFLVTLVPFLGIFQAGLWPEMADRYAYLTYIGIYIILSWGIYDLLGKWKFYRFVIPILSSGAVATLMMLTWFQVGYWKDSESLFKHAIDSNKNNFMAYNNLGAALLEKGDLDGAISHFERSIEIQPYFQGSHFNLGRSFFKEKRYEKAIEQLQICIKNNPQMADNYGLLGNIMLEMGNYDEGIKNLNIALRISPHYEKGWSLLGQAYYNKGNLKKSIECLQEALNIVPGDIPSVRKLDQAKTALNEYVALNLRLQELIKADPKNPLLLTKLGDSYRQIGSNNEAIAQYQKAISIKPQSIEALDGLVIVYSNIPEYAKALDVLKNMRQIRPDNPDIYYNIACIYAKQYMVEKSIKWLKQSINKGFHNWVLLEKDPDLVNIKNTSYVIGLMKIYKN